MRIYIFYTDAGGGHRATANAIQEVLKQQRPSYQVIVVNLYKEILAELDLARRFLNIDGESIYNYFFLNKNCGYLTKFFLKLLHFNQRLFYQKGVYLVKQFLQAKPCDLVISVMPHINKFLYEAVQQVPPTKFIELITDFDECLPNFWIQDTNVTYLCGTQRLVKQLEQYGVSRQNIVSLSGVVINPHFYELAKTNKAKGLLELGLQPNLPTGLMMFGGYGSNHMLAFAKALNRFKQPMQLIIICGNNQTLLSDLERLVTHYPKKVLGFTKEMPHYMDLADFFIGKPGPGSVSEALVKQLPLLLQTGSMTLLQERYVVQWVHEQQLGLTFHNARDIAAVLQRLLQQLAIYQQRAAQINSHAVFELPAIIDNL